MIYEPTAKIKMATTSEGSRLGSQEMQGWYSILVYVVDKIFIKVNDLKCQICRAQQSLGQKLEKLIYTTSLFEILFYTT